MDPENLCNGCLEPSGGGKGKGRGGGGNFWQVLKSLLPRKQILKLAQKCKGKIGNVVPMLQPSDSRAAVASSKQEFPRISSSFFLRIES